MRELVYLSERKLCQFQPDRRRWWRRVRELGIKGPLSTGELRVGLSDDTASRRPDLATVLKHIDRSDRPAKWYADDNQHAAGDWIQFECRLLYDDDIRGILVFWEPDLFYPSSRNAKKLLLHGSMENLLGRNIGDLAPGSAWSIGTQPSDFLRALRAQDGELSGTDRDEGLGESLAVDIRVLLEEGRNYQIGYGHEEHASALSSWMAGYARVTCDLGRILVASPLYVEFVSKPKIDM
jgi:hypothetical protein